MRAIPESIAKSIKIGPTVFTVSEVDELWVDGESLWGHIVFAESEIKVLKSLADAPKQATLLHEVVHAVLDLAGHRDASQNESIVGALSNGLLQVLRDNPEFTAGLLGEGKDGH